MRLDALRRRRPFALLWTVGLALRLAAGLRRVALPWLVVSRTGSPLQLGVTLALGSVDALLAPVVGPLVDRLPRRRVVATGVALFGGGLLALPALSAVGALSLPAVYAAVVVLGVGQFLHHVTRQAWLPELVDDLDAANAVVHGTDAASRVVFLLAGGLLTAATTATTALGVAGAAALAGAVPLAALPPGRVDATDEAAATDLRPRSLVAQTRTGLGYLRGTLAVLVAVAVGINLVMPAYGLLFAALGETRFGAALAYTLTLVGFETGKLLGNGVVARADWDRTAAVAGGVVACGLATLGLAGVVAVADATRAGLAAVAVAAAVVGATQPAFNVPTDSVLQASVPERDRGTVVTVANALYQVPFPLAYLGGGWVAARLSPAAGFAVAGAVLLVVGWAARGRFDAATAG